MTLDRTPYSGNVCTMTRTYFDDRYYVNQDTGELGWGDKNQPFFNYDNLNHNLSTADHIALVRLLRNQREGKPFFYHKPWEHIRKLYRDEGDLDAVREINWAYDKAKAEFDFDTAAGLKKAWYWGRNGLYDKLAGHGHKLFRVVPWIIGTMVLFWIWAFGAYHTAHIVPTSSRIYMNECYLGTKALKDCPGWEYHSRGWHLEGGPNPVIDAPPVPLPDGYPAFHSFLYTIDTFVPFADLHQESYWTVTDDGPWGEWMRAIFSAFMAIGGILSAIFAAAMFSLIRKN